MKHWAIDQIKWDQFDLSLVDKNIVSLIKAASVIERNSADYTVYLNNVFAQNAELKQIFQDWEADEVQHGEVLGRWAMMADPKWNYHDSFDRFRRFYKVDLNTENSIRGSHTGEFIARAMVEAGTSSYYSALADYVQEPVLKEICRKIAGDEFRHYKLFYDCMKKYLPEDNLSKWTRAKIALGRIIESQDDELASAFHITNEPEGMPYNHKRCIALYMTKAMPLYRHHHVARIINMMFKTVGWMPPVKWQQILIKMSMLIITFQHKLYMKQISGLV